MLKNKALLIWLLSFVFLLLVYIADTGPMFTRLLLPAIPVFAIAWSSGFSKILERKKLKKVVIIMLIICITGFIFAEFVKTSMATNAWRFYQEDFDWIKENIAKESLFCYNGQCLAVNINQFAMPFMDKFKKGSYAWINQGFKLESCSILDNITLGI